MEPYFEDGGYYRYVEHDMKVEITEVIFRRESQERVFLKQKEW